MDSVIEKIKELKLVPVVKIDNKKDALFLAEALLEGGLTCAEITFRTDAAADSIEIISKEFPEMFIGAGTLLTCEQADRASDAGAKFFVSPGFNKTVVLHCLEKQRTFIPGIVTPGEVEQVLSLGLKTVKFFPAEAAGGIKMIKALSAPYTDVKFMPTGGINADNILNYLAIDSVIACGGSWMVPSSLINEGNFKEIARLSKIASEIVRGAAL